MLERSPDFFDPITLEVLRNALESIADEMGAVLKRTSFSPNIKERMDASCAIFDAKGRLTGELRIVGLFTSTAYTRSVMKIPYLRSKAASVIAKSGFDPRRLRLEWIVPDDPRDFVKKVSSFTELVAKL